MPHVIVKLWPGKSEEQKKELAEAITRSVTTILNYGDDAVSVAMDEVAPNDWAAKVYRADIVAQPDKIYKKPRLHDVTRRRKPGMRPGIVCRIVTSADEMREGGMVWLRHGAEAAPEAGA